MTTPPQFHDQFILQRGGGAAPGGWSTRTLHGWTLSTHPNLPVTDLLGPDATPFGWLLGWAINPDGRLARGTTTPVGPFEPWLYGHGGRFAAVVVDGTRSRFYLDPAGSLAAVYSDAEPAVASTASVLHWADLEAYAERMAAEPTLEPNQFYPAGLTADPRVLRLLPNHYLDLDLLQPVRHWPAAPIPRRSDDDPAIHNDLGRLAACMRSNIEGITAAHRAYVGLTAGRDSRMVLAAARSALDRIQFVTFMYEDEARRPDIHTARRIARASGLDHVGVPLVEPTEPQKQDYLRRVGWAGHWGKARDFDIACRRHLDLSRAWITGFGGEVGRAFYWRQEDEASRAPAPRQLIERLNLPRDERTLAAWTAWQDSVPHQDTFDLLDMAYIEQRLGCWAGPHMYGTAPFAANLSAFVHRDAFTAMMSLPLTFRRGQRMADALLEIAWPDLRRLPFQQFTGLRRVASIAGQHMSAAAGAITRRARRTAGHALRAIGAKA
jgi:hypothetical protein